MARVVSTLHREFLISVIYLELNCDPPARVESRLWLSGGVSFRDRSNGAQVASGQYGCPMLLRCLPSKILGCQYESDESRASR